MNSFARRPVLRSVRHDHRAGLHRPLFGAVFVDVPAALVRHRLEVLVDVVDAAGRVHPAGAIVEPLVDEELAPRERAVRVQALVAHHLRFGAEEEGRVRIDQQQRVVSGGVRGRDGDAVRSGRLDVRRRGIQRRLRRRLRAAVAVEGFELREVHALDVAADAAFGERERHPRLEPFDHLRGDRRVRIQVVVQAVGPRPHQLLQPVGARVELRLHVVGIDEELHPQVAVDLLFAFRLGEPSDRIEVVRLDAVEIVLGLRVDDAEHRVRVGLAVHVRDAPRVADDRDVLRLPFRGGDVPVAGRLRRARRAREDREQHQLLHGVGFSHSGRVSGAGALSAPASRPAASSRGSASSAERASAATRAGFRCRSG